jgi:hypothetical protein
MSKRAVPEPAESMCLLHRATSRSAAEAKIGYSACMFFE